jgi:DNA-directed RNA polymerase subunit M/transcription elongation factor TFIIS
MINCPKCNATNIVKETIVPEHFYQSQKPDGTWTEPSGGRNYSGKTSSFQCRECYHEWDDEEEEE